MRGVRLRARGAAVLIAGVACAGLVGSALPASAAPVRGGTPKPAPTTTTTAPSSTAVTVTGGSTTSVSAPGLAQTLLAAGIIPVPSQGATITGLSGLGLNLGNIQLTLKFPIVGGTLDPATFLSGTIQHSGALTFLRPLGLRSVTVSNFLVYNDATPRLVATVNGKRQVTLFTLDLSALQLGGKVGEFDLGNVGLLVSADGAAALNNALGVKVFYAGQKFATGTTVVLYKPAS